MSSLLQKLSEKKKIIEMDKQTLSNIIILVPCFLGLPIVGYQLYLNWLFETPLIWSESFTFFVICSVLGSIAGFGIFLKLKWARIIALVLFITGIVIWFVILSIEYTNNRVPTLSWLLLIYGICISILLLYSEKMYDDESYKKRNFDDILDK